KSAAGLDTVELRHHHVEENEVGTMLLDRSQRLFTVSSLEGLVAMPFQPRHDDIAIRLVVIDDEDTRGIVHNERPQTATMAHTPGSWQATGAGYMVGRRRHRPPPLVPCFHRRSKHRT